MKVEYLRQTDVKNRFIVIINPAFMDFGVHDINYFKICLKKENIEIMQFQQSELLPMPKIEHEGHLNAIVHENYSQMIIKKLKVFDILITEPTKIRAAER